MGIAAIVCMQIVLNHLPPQVGPLSKFRAIGALAYAPLIEEIVRAAVLFTLASRWGRGVAVVATGVLFGSLHSHPIYATIQQTALTLMLLWTAGSIPANANAHFLMNLVVILHDGVART